MGRAETKVFHYIHLCKKQGLLSLLTSLWVISSKLYDSHILENVLLCMPIDTLSPSVCCFIHWCVDRYVMN